MTKSLQGKNGNATADEMAAMGLTKDTIQPITCATCHDPHDEGNMVANPPVIKVRIDGDTAMLPSGFKAMAVGKGALCITCHNTRNGAHNDAAGPDPSPDRAPHVAAQGDVIMGENAYFVKTGARSAHANIEDSCVTCHVESSPPPKPYTTSTNHSFAASTAICGDCHGKYENADNLMAANEVKLKQLGDKLSAYALNKLPDKVMLKDYTPHKVGSRDYDVASDATSVNKTDIRSLTPVEVHGRQGFVITFTAPVTFTYSPSGEASHTQSLSQAQVQLGGLTKDGTALAFAVTDPLYRVGWNYWLIHGDASMGVHNPSFVTDVLPRHQSML
ncbi:MAG: hypothetical protein HYX87_07985 [Chloroflexi bacterium]|nr:hypothetical protein [Chloroflexota bacterium]